MSDPCRCGVPSWRALRLAIGLTQRDMGDLLGVTEGWVGELESTRLGHHCPSRRAMADLRAFCRRPAVAARLVAAGVPPPVAPILELVDQSESA